MDVNSKLALFFDFLFFDPRVDSIMNIGTKIVVFCFYYYYFFFSLKSLNDVPNRAGDASDDELPE
jgi:hypothetical protein